MKTTAHAVLSFDGNVLIEGLNMQLPYIPQTLPVFHERINKKLEYDIVPFKSN